jgi:tagatose 1,6-diphosphate aldolase
MMEEFKALVTEVLTRYASAILLDPEWGIGPSKKRAKDAGLLLAYEKTGYDAQTPGRLPDLLDVWSVRRLKAEGADCIKILLYYAPSDAKAINDHKHAWVERIGDECVANDIPFFLELIGYEEGIDEKSLEYAKKKPGIVTASISEFSKDRYNVDVLKIEVPINMKFVGGAACNTSGQVAYSRDEAKELFLESSKAAGRLFIYLSAGVSNGEFTETLELAGESGGYRASLRTCDGRMASPSMASRAARRSARGQIDWRRKHQNVNTALKPATPWFEFYGATSADALALITPEYFRAGDRPQTLFPEGMRIWVPSGVALPASDGA